MYKDLQRAGGVLLCGTNTRFTTPTDNNNNKYHGPIYPLKDMSLEHCSCINV
jgi:hypothetical protein